MDPLKPKPSFVIVPHWAVKAVIDSISIGMMNSNKMITERDGGL